MAYQTMIDDVCWRMLAFDQGDAKRIQHFLKVHDYARLIAVREARSEEHTSELQSRI